tara:strand:- start:4093 stop:4404 length:312 start_codon:yes stop_codon:yes gene_type:complete
MNCKYLIIIGAFLCSANFAHAETKIEHSCKDALFDIAHYMMSETNVTKINRAVNKATKYSKIRQYIRTKWIPRVRSDKTLTPNTYMIDAEKYTKECANFATPG